MRLFLDECLSPQIARLLNGEGEHLAVHPRDFGGLGQADHAVLTRCVDENLVLVTVNAVDFRKLIGAVDIHPGLIILPSVSRKESETLLRAAIAFLEAKHDPMDVMVNHVLEVSIGQTPVLYSLPVRKN